MSVGIPEWESNEEAQSYGENKKETNRLKCDINERGRNGKHDMIQAIKSVMETGASYLLV